MHLLSCDRQHKPEMREWYIKLRIKPVPMGSCRVQLTPRGHMVQMYRSGDSDYDCDCGEDTALTQPGLELDPLKVRALTMD